METPEQRFKRIAEYRVKRILNAIRILSNCGNKRVYSYTQEQVEKIFAILQKQLEIARSKFTPDNKEIDFTL